MMFSESVLLYYTTVFILGFLVGRVTGSSQQKIPVYQQTNSVEQKAERSSSENFEKKKKIVMIDEKTFVTNLTTDSLTKKGGELGAKTTVNDDMSASVSRLAQLKKNK